MEIGFWSPVHFGETNLFIFLYSNYSFGNSTQMSQEGLCNWEQIEKDIGPHISVLVMKQVLEEVVELKVSLRCGSFQVPATISPLACKKQSEQIGLSEEPTALEEHTPSSRVGAAA